MVLFGGCAWFYLGGAWFYLGGVHGFIWGVHGFIQGACVVLFGVVCMVLFGGRAWFYSGGCAWFYLGGMRGFFSFFGYNEIRSMSGQYASYWNAFLFCNITALGRVLHCFIFLDEFLLLCLTSSPISLEDDILCHSSRLTKFSSQRKCWHSRNLYWISKVSRIIFHDIWILQSALRGPFPKAYLFQRHIFTKSTSMLREIIKSRA